MSARLLVCLVFLTISASESTSDYNPTVKDIVYNARNIKTLVTEGLNDPPGGVAVTNQNINENKPNATGNVVNKQPPTKGQDKNTTDSIKPATEGMDAQSSQTVFSYPPYSNYEVTEKVIDIPDDRVPAGPIVANYSIPTPLNLGKPSNDTDSNKNPDTINKTKKNCITIFHLNAEFDNKKNEVIPNKVGGIFKGFKEYIQSFHRGIVNGFHRFFHKHENLNGGRFKRDVRMKVSHDEGVKNVDKADYFVRQRHISLT